MIDSAFPSTIKEAIAYLAIQKYSRELHRILDEERMLGAVWFDVQLQLPDCIVGAGIICRRCTTRFPCCGYMARYHVDMNLELRDEQGMLDRLGPMFGVEVPSSIAKDMINHVVLPAVAHFRGYDA